LPYSREKTLFFPASGRGRWIEGIGRTVGRPDKSGEFLLIEFQRAIALAVAKGGEESPIGATTLAPGGINKYPLKFLVNQATELLNVWRNGHFEQRLSKRSSL
jgi:hypothetical protein